MHAAKWCNQQQYAAPQVLTLLRSQPRTNLLFSFSSKLKHQNEVRCHGSRLRRWRQRLRGSQVRKDRQKQLSRAAAMRFFFLYFTDSNGRTFLS